jgi:hypothetical protein
MKKNLTIAFAALLLTVASQSIAQTKKNDLSDDVRVNLLFGLNQPLLGGFNVEGNLFYKRLVFDYSHGVSLNFNNSILDEENAALGVDVVVPWTTGFGIGYRFNRWLNIRAEPKWHKFELYDQNAERSQRNLLASYTTFSMGIGAYANIQPFKNKDNFLKGFMVAPSVRWWPRVASSLENNEVQFYSSSLQRTVTHKAMEVGVNNTPLIINVSVGYTLGLGK